MLIAVALPWCHFTSILTKEIHESESLQPWEATSWKLHVEKQRQNELCLSHTLLPQMLTKHKDFEKEMLLDVQYLPRSINVLC